MKEIRYHNSVLIFFDELFDVLIDQGYFSQYESSAKYLDDLILFIENNIDKYPIKKAPEYFSKFGHDLFYMCYERNAQTTWYIFFEQGIDFLYIKHITNNHVVGKFI